MSSTEVASDGAPIAPEAGTAEMRLEAVVLPVSDVDRAKPRHRPGRRARARLGGAAADAAD